MYIYAVVQKRQGRHKAKFESALGQECRIVSYDELNLRAVERLRPRGVIVSGFADQIENYSVKGLRGLDEVMHNADLPILGICGGHQLIGFGFNRNLKRARRLFDEPIRRLRAGEDLPRHVTGDARGTTYFKAEGYYPIRRLKNDPLFRGLPRTMLLKCAHYCEVKKLPEDFELLASSGHCAIEAMRHRERLLYGVQFHPEGYEAPFLDGRRILENFGVIVEKFWG